MRDTTAFGAAGGVGGTVLAAIREDKKKPRQPKVEAAKDKKPHGQEL